MFSAKPAGCGVECRTTSVYVSVVMRTRTSCTRLLLQYCYVAT